MLEVAGASVTPGSLGPGGEMEREGSSRRRTQKRPGVRGRAVLASELTFRATVKDRRKVDNLPASLFQMELLITSQWLLNHDALPGPSRVVMFSYT